MDWGRAKNVLIYAFLLLNMVLGYQLWNDLQEQADSNLDFTSLESNIQQTMDDKRIKVLAKIPTETPQLSKISYRLVEDEQDNKVIELEQPIDSKLIYTPRDLANALKTSIPEIGDYRYDEPASRAEEFILHPLVNGEWPLFKIELKLYSSNQKIVSYQRQMIEISSGDEDKAQRVLSASKALGNLIENFLPEGAVVTQIELGYYGEVFNSDAHLPAAPAWRFLLESGKEYYVQGISGDVISPNTEKTKE
ncbi:regulatory protein YycI of two-component signal transduction system YycFG [Fontibacillus solani]|uniref:Two-component signal transduction system YycFG, regulatory protein YycI n=2 Tax=Fontibacillus TaxID=995014 RepID=A0A1G7LD52_9BACL|nr:MULTISPECIES: two-component system regulatory protein YycI [Fontibacillus]MBA9085960.1 regulatory protein YycI of two-component signal transduction system YycFG [Fontibacillus solani]SDF47321.1 Two-component signal transduction system YycFG, regulatory protein YycI [Fontibacillus panacisegetis]